MSKEIANPRLDDFETRVLEVISREAIGSNRFAYLEGKSGISAQSWKNYWYRKQHATSSMLAFVLSSWPQYAEWMSTGRILPTPQVMPGQLANAQICFTEMTYEGLQTQIVINLANNNIDVWGYCYEAATMKHRSSASKLGALVGRVFIESFVGDSATLAVLSSAGEWEATSAGLHAWLLILLGRCSHQTVISGSTAVDGLSVSDYAMICHRFNLTVLENPSTPSHPHTVGNLELVQIAEPHLSLNTFTKIPFKGYADFDKDPIKLFNYGNQKD